MRCVSISARKTETWPVSELEKMTSFLVGQLTSVQSRLKTLVAARP